LQGTRASPEPLTMVIVTTITSITACARRYRKGRCDRAQSTAAFFRAR
jgi:hypothetical protein